MGGWVSGTRERESESKSSGRSHHSGKIYCHCRVFTVFISGFRFYLWQVETVFY